MALVPGSKLGSYEIRGTLGAGGMGRCIERMILVWRGTWPSRSFRRTSRAIEESLARFTREARAVAALNHPHIVTIHSTEDVDGLRFITMELIEGRTLDQVIPSTGASLAQFFNMSIAIAEACPRRIRSRSPTAI